MYLNILKKDLKSKKTMNMILLVFIILATMFVASGLNNVFTVMNGTDYYLDKAEIGDFVVITMGNESTGYADGIPRLLTATGHNVEINGKLYPIIGNICMDQFMIDITGADIKAGDEITIFGGDGEISYTETAKKIMTIPHELMCAVAKRVPKVYTDNGKITYIRYGI